MRAVLLGLAAFGLTTSAAAQTAAPKPADPNQVWEPAVLLRPMELALAAPDLMPGARYTPRCEDTAESNGNSALPLGNGLPLMLSNGYQLSPRLSVLAFSRLGCTTTAGLGGAGAYTVPLAKKVALVLSGGFYAMPQVLDRGTAMKALFRADVVWQGTGTIVSRTGIEALNVRGGTATTKLGVTYGFTF